MSQVLMDALAFRVKNMQKKKAFTPGIEIEISCRTLERIGKHVGHVFEDALYDEESSLIEGTRLHLKSLNIQLVACNPEYK